MDRVEISDFVPDFNFDWSIFRKENIRLTTDRRKPKVCRQFLVAQNADYSRWQGGMIRIDDERGERGRSSSILSF